MDQHQRAEFFAITPVRQHRGMIPPRPHVISLATPVHQPTDPKNQLYANSRLFRNFQLSKKSFLVFVCFRETENGECFVYIPRHHNHRLRQLRCESTTVAQWSMISGFIHRNGMGQKIIKRQPHESLRREMSAGNENFVLWERLSGAIRLCRFGAFTNKFAPSSNCGLSEKRKLHHIHGEIFMSGLMRMFCSSATSRSLTT